MSEQQSTPISQFWRSLVEDGRVLIFEKEPPPASDLPSLDRLLTELDQDNRLRLAFTPPALDFSVARWACVIIYRACQFLVIRDLDSELLQQEFSVACPHDLSASTIYSADLALQHLGELISLASGIAPNDPLTIMLYQFGQHWPLSSIGIKKLAMEEGSPLNFETGLILADPSLRSLYVDRIIKYNDTTRLEDQNVAQLVQAAIGPFPQLNPKLSRYFAKEKTHEG